MTPKKVAFQGPVGKRNAILMGWKLLVSFTVMLCVVAIMRMNSYYSGVSSSSSLSSSRKIDSVLSTENIFGDKSLRPVESPKVAFLFLVKRDMPLDFLWDNFFQNADVANFSIYIHSTPGFEFDESTTRSRFFYGRQIRNSVQVGWGEVTMIEAERLLLAAALEDSCNQRFVLLSESCVPLYNFTYVYNYLMASPRSFVDSFIDTKESRYNKMMSPVIAKSNWRKGSQWISLIRRHAVVIVNDSIVFENFQKHCKRHSSIGVQSKGELNVKLKKQRDCVPDEHYVQTLLTLHGLQDELERRTLTYTEWAATKSDNHAWHPMTFSFRNAGMQKINKIKEINHMYFETEKRVEWCKVDSVRVPCFLFARKFSRGAAMHLLADELVTTIDEDLQQSSQS